MSIDIRIPRVDEENTMRRSITIVLALAALLLTLLGFGAWAISSPVGGSPDEDYHLGSMWCPRPIEGSGCEYTLKNGAFFTVEVPQTVARPQACLAHKPWISAACMSGLSDTVLEPSERFDDGAYPIGYYQFGHLFVGPDVERTALVMRFVNILLGIGGLALALVLARPRVRHTALIAAIIAWVPMGVYFIASNNPSSWAITGCFLYTVALTASLESEGRRRWGLLCLVAFGAVLSITSRSDSAFYLTVITMAVWVLGGVRRSNAAPLILSLVASLVGLAVFSATGQTSRIMDDGGMPVTHESIGRVFLDNVIGLPEYMSEFWGLHRGPGWFDVPLLGWSTVTMIVLALCALVVGARHLYHRKVWAAVIVGGALTGIPVLGLTLRHVRPTVNYQGRYMLPLLAVFLFVWLMRRGAVPCCRSGKQLAVLLAVAGVANSLALYRLIQRYSLGITSQRSFVSLANPTWWPWSWSPTAVWIGGSAAMAMGVVVLVILSLRSIQQQVAGSATATEGER